MFACLSVAGCFPLAVIVTSFTFSFTMPCEDLKGGGEHRNFPRNRGGAYGERRVIAGQEACLFFSAVHCYRSSRDKPLYRKDIGWFSSAG